MKIVVGCHTNAMNKQHIKRWVDFHSQYAELVLVIDEKDSKNMWDEVGYAVHKGVDVHLTNFEADKTTEGFLRIEYCYKVMQDKFPTWYGLIPSDEIFTRIPTKEMFEDENVDAYAFEMFNLWGDENHYRVDGFWEYATHNYLENIRLFRNKFGACKINRTGVHTSLTPIEVKNSRLHFVKNMAILHYAFVDPTEWDKRVTEYGTEYADGGGHTALPMHAEAVLKELPDEYKVLVEA